MRKFVFHPEILIETRKISNFKEGMLIQHRVSKIIHPFIEIIIRIRLLQRRVFILRDFFLQCMHNKMHGASNHAHVDCIHDTLFITSAEVSVYSSTVISCIWLATITNRSVWISVVSLHIGWGRLNYTHTQTKESNVT